MTRFATAMAAVIDGFVRLVIVPVTGLIPVLVRTGILFAAFALLWASFLVAMVANPAALDAAWRALAGLALPLQLLAWILFLPVVGGLWIWSTDWPLVLRVALVVALAGWNLLVFLPKRESRPVAAAS